MAIGRVVEPGFYNSAIGHTLWYQQYLTSSVSLNQVIKTNFYQITLEINKNVGREIAISLRGIIFVKTWQFGIEPDAEECITCVKL